MSRNNTTLIYKDEEMFIVSNKFKCEYSVVIDNSIVIIEPGLTQCRAELDKQIIDIALQYRSSTTFYDRCYEPYVDAFGSHLRSLGIELRYNRELSNLYFEFMNDEVTLGFRFYPHFLRLLDCTYKREEMLPLPVDASLEQLRQVLVVENKPCAKGDGEAMVFLDTLSLVNHLFSENGVCDYIKRLPEDKRNYCMRALLAGDEIPRLVIMADSVDFYEEGVGSYAWYGI